MRLVGVKAYILAAGLSSRFPGFKLLTSVAGAPLVAWPTLALSSVLGVDNVIVVLGYRAVDVARALRGLRVKKLYNPSFRGGLSTSIRLAAEHARSMDLKVILLQPGDSPYPAVPLIEEIVQKALTDGSARPACNGAVGFPVAVRLDTLRRAARVLRGDTGLRGAINPSLVDAGDYPCSLDVDDYNGLLKWMDAVRRYGYPWQL